MPPGCAAASSEPPVRCLLCGQRREDVFVGLGSSWHCRWRRLPTWTMLLHKAEMLLCYGHYQRGPSVACIPIAARMASMQCEAPLAELAARYDDDSEEEAVTKASQSQPQGVVAPTAPLADAAAASGGAPADAAAALIAAATAGQDEDEEWGEDEEEDGDWDSGDEDLASAMEWADLREGEDH